MKISRYIFNLAFVNTIISILVIIGIVWVSQSFRYIKFILEKGGSLFDFLKLSIFSVPSWLYIGVSFGVFFGLLMTYSKFDNERELVVMKSAGLDALQLAKPGFGISLIFSLILLLNQHILLPKSYTYFKNYENKIRFNSPQYIFNEATFFDFDKTKTFFFRKKISNTKIQDIFIQDRSNKNQNIEIFAKEGVLKIKNGELFIIFKKGTKIISDSDGMPTIIDFEVDTISLESLKKTKKINSENVKEKPNRVIEMNELSFFELLNEGKIKKNVAGKYISEAHSRIINSFMPIVFSLIVMSFILLSNFSRSNKIINKIFIYFFVIFSQVSLILIKNLVTGEIKFLYFFYMFPLLIIILCYLSLRFEYLLKIITVKLKLSRTLT